MLANTMQSQHLIFKIKKTLCPATDEENLTDKGWI